MSFLLWHAVVTTALIAVFALVVVVQWCAEQVRVRFRRNGQAPEATPALPSSGAQPHAA